MERPEKKPTGKRKYTKPKINSEEIFETTVLIGACQGEMDCPKPTVPS